MSTIRSWIQNSYPKAPVVPCGPTLLIQLIDPRLDDEAPFIVVSRLSKAVRTRVLRGS